MVKKHSKDIWENFFQVREKQDHPLWPCEPVIKTVFGNYLKRKIELKNQGNVLDVGCGFGNNLLPFIYRGWNGYGTEISEEITTQVSTELKQRGIDADIRVGQNMNLPFDDSMFDIILSISVLHYENCREDIDKALAEYKRVLNDGGSIIIYTTGPKHDIFQKAEQLDNNRYRVSNYDFRNGEEYFYFDSKKYLKYFMERHFADVEVGQITEGLMTAQNDFLIAVCREPL